MLLILKSCTYVEAEIRPRGETGKKPQVSLALLLPLLRLRLRNQCNGWNGGTKIVGLSQDQKFTSSSFILGWLWLLGVIWGGAPFCSWKSIWSLKPQMILWRTYRNGWSFGRSPPLNGVTEEGADDDEGEEEVGRQGRGREESVVGVPVKSLVEY